MDRSANNSTFIGCMPDPEPAPAPPVPDARLLQEAIKQLARMRAHAPDRAALACAVFPPFGPPELRIRFSGAAGEVAGFAVGRHTSVDLDAGESTSLRHAMLVAWPAALDGEVFLEILDLNSTTGMYTADGRPVDALRATMSALTLIGRTWILGAVAGARAPLVLDETGGPGAASPMGVLRSGHHVPISARRSGNSSRSVVTSLPGGGRSRSVDLVRITPADLARGALIGRYERCAVSTGDTIHGLSRVHAMLIHRAGRPWVVDVGSYNGTTVTGDDAPLVVLDERRRVAPLPEHARLSLGSWQVDVEVVAFPPRLDLH